MKIRTRRKIPTVTHAGISIREVRKDYFMVDIFRDGKRERKCFDDLAAAKTHCEILGTKIKNEGTSALNLTPNQRSDATSALALLKGSATLKTAAAFWMRHNARGEGVTLKDLGNLFMKAIAARGCRATTIAEREHKITRLVNDLGDHPACSVTKDMLVEWLDGYKLTGVTRDGYRRCYHAVFEYALKEKIVDYNPVSAMEAFRSDEKLPIPLTVEAVTAIMAAAEKYAPVMVPFLAVQFFGGLRPGEAKGLKWEAVNFTEKTIRVLPETSKMRQARYIEMNDTLVAWLTRYRKDSGPVGITTHCQFAYYMSVKDCEKKKGLLAAAGIKWIQDGPRKTYASMHFATYQDGPQLAAILGHTGNQDILFRHYRGLVKKTEGLKFWQIVPEEKNNDMQLSKVS
jgi:integrase